MKLIVPGIAILFCIFWIYMAVRMGAPWFFVLFGIGFLGLLIYVIVRNCSGQSHTSSDFPEEPDDAFAEEPADEAEMDFDKDLDEELGAPAGRGPVQTGVCPFCGGPVTSENHFCESCGRKLS